MSHEQERFDVGLSSRSHQPESRHLPWSALQMLSEALDHLRAVQVHFCTLCVLSLLVCIYHNLDPVGRVRVYTVHTCTFADVTFFFPLKFEAAGASRGFLQRLWMSAHSAKCSVQSEDKCSNIGELGFISCLLSFWMTPREGCLFRFSDRLMSAFEN